MTDFFYGSCSIDGVSEGFAGNDGFEVNPDELTGIHFKEFAGVAVDINDDAVGSMKDNAIDRGVE